MDRTSRQLLYALCALSIGFLGSVLRAVPVAAQCDYYASPAGKGNRLSQSTPFRISDFLGCGFTGKDVVFALW